MSQHTDGEYKTFLAGEALVAHARVKLSSGEVVYSDAADDDDSVGVTVESCADGEYICVKLPGCAGGSVPVRCAGAITSGAYVYAAADGEIQASLPGGTPLGIALSAATAAHDVIECLMFDRTVDKPESVIVLTAGEALAVNRLVKIATGKVAYSDESDNGNAIGTTLNATAAADVDVAVKLLGSAGGPHVVSNATGNIAVGDLLYSEDDGKVQTTLSSGVKLGYAISARTGAGVFNAVLYDLRPANASA